MKRCNGDGIEKILQHSRQISDEGQSDIYKHDFNVHTAAATTLTISDEEHLEMFTG